MRKGLHAIGRMDWLGRARALGYLRLLAALNVAMLLVLVLTARGGVDRNGFLLGSDFISFWTTGRMLHAGADVYDAGQHIAAQRAYFASSTGYTAFFYPPSFLPFCWPLGLTGYFPALAAWLLATGAVYVAALRAWLGRAGLSRHVAWWLAFAAFPAVPIVITHGQTAFLAAGLLAGALLLAGSRPWLAGVLLGLATFKPQLGLVVPVVLILSRSWRVSVIAVPTAVLLGVVSAIWFGPQVWPDWLQASSRAQDAMAQGAVGYAKMTSVFAALKLIGLPGFVAYVGQAVSALAVACLCGAVAWRQRWSTGLGALALSAAPLATPFMLDYDLVLIAFPIAWLAGEGLRSGFADWEKLAILTAFIAPAIARPLAMKVGLPVVPLIAALLFTVVWRRVRQLPPASAPPA